MRSKTAWSYLNAEKVDVYMALKERKSYRRKFERVTIIVRLQEKESFVDNATYVATKSHHSGTQISGKCFTTILFCNFSAIFFVTVLRA